jgi:hypothetical protein
MSIAISFNCVVAHAGPGKYKGGKKYKSTQYKKINNHKTNKQINLTKKLIKLLLKYKLKNP